MALTPEQEEAARRLQERLERENRDKSLDEIQAKDPRGDHRNPN